MSVTSTREGSAAADLSSYRTLGWALSYAARGFSVFPTRPNSKVPLTPHGFKDATTDAEPIRAWWTLNRDAGIGIATGAASDLVVLDVDGEEGERSLADLPHAIGDTWCALTPHGAHVYFRHPGYEVRNSAGKLGPGLDVRGDGGYVVAPPSTIGDGAYEWAGEHRKLQPWPDWLDVRQDEPVRATESPSTYRPRPTGRPDRYAAAALERELSALLAAPQGERNASLSAAAWSLFRLDALDPDATSDALLDAALRLGLTEREAAATIKSAREKRQR